MQHPISNGSSAAKSALNIGNSFPPSSMRQESERRWPGRGIMAAREQWHDSLSLSLSISFSHYLSLSLSLSLSFPLFPSLSFSLSLSLFLSLSSLSLFSLFFFLSLSFLSFSLSFFCLSLSLIGWMCVVYYFICRVQ
jgi:hypothetical protein